MSMKVLKDHEGSDALAEWFNETMSVCFPLDGSSHIGNVKSYVESKKDSDAGHWISGLIIECHKEIHKCHKEIHKSNDRDSHR